MNLSKVSMAALLFSCLVYSNLPAQESSPTAEETMVVGLSNIDARGVGNALNQLGFDLMIAAPDPGRLVLRGQSEEIAKAAQLVRQLDEPEVPASSKETIAYLPLGNSPAKGIMGLVETVAPSGPGTAYALDQLSRTLIVRASDATIEKVRQLVKAIDQPAETLMVEFFFIRGTMSASKQDPERNLPPALKPATDALTATGFQNFELLAPIAISARQGERFSSASAPLPGPESSMFLVEGDVDVDSGNENVQLRVEAEIRGPKVREDGNTVYAQVFSAKTTVNTKIGNYTILSAAPSGTAEKSAIALVVRVKAAK